MTAVARFASVAWTAYTGSANQHPVGLIAGGMADGTIQFYDPAAIMEGKGAPDAVGLVGTVKAQASSGPIAALQFSSLDTHLLCAGAFNGRVSILDCSDPHKPTSMEPGPPGQHSAAEITSVAWNTAVAHILATAAGDGVVTVWDIQSKKAWCEIRAESAGQAVADVSWNPAQGLHLLTASADDRNPVLRVWDLGASTSVPIATLTGHSAGLFRAAWCPHDDSLLLTVSKDNRTLLWDLSSLQAVAELPLDTPQQQQQQHAHQSGHSAGVLFASGRPGLQEQKQLRYDIKWSPFQRGVALTCSLDKKVQVHSLLALATYAGRPPAWMKPKASITTGFGGMIVSCGAATGSTVCIRTVPEKPNLVTTSIALETDLSYYKAVSMIDFCKIQQQKSTAVEDMAIWGFMQVVFETNARQELLPHLGFDADEIIAAASRHSEDRTNGISNGLANDSSDKVSCMSSSTQDIVKKTLLVGNYETAVDCCLESGNYADALVLASCGGGDLWAKTMERYFTSETPKRPFLSLVSGIIRNEWDQFVNNSDTASWQETLAVISTYAQAEEFPNLCILLGDKLLDAGEDNNASLCYMCAYNLDRSVLFWKKQLFEKADGSYSSSTDLLILHEFVVKVSVFLQASGPSVVLSADIEELFTKYSQALAEQGLLATATKYCRGSTANCRELRDRLYRSRSSPRCCAYLDSIPEFPFNMVDVQQSRGQVLSQPHAIQDAVDPTTNGPEYTGSQNEHHAHDQQAYGVDQYQPKSEILPAGWVAIQDPGSGSTYYANEATGETTWELPGLAAPAPSLLSYANQNPSSGASLDSSQRTQPISQTRQQKPSIVSKYGDGFVSSASNPELAYQYGNVGTSNPYGDSTRPGTAAAVLQTPQKAPVSGSLNFDSLQLSNHHSSIKDALLGASVSLDQAVLNPIEKRQLSEAEKGIAILVKKLARDDLSGDIVDQVFALANAVSQRDFATALAIQTALANCEWRDQKDWLKGLKVLIQLASKKL